MIRNGAKALTIKVNNKNGQTVIQWELTGKLYKKDKLWISECPSLELATCGKTKKEVIKNTTEIITLFFSECLERGTLDKALNHHNHGRIKKLEEKQ